MSKQYGKEFRIFRDKKVKLYFASKEDEESYIDRMKGNVLFWLEEDYGGKKVTLNPVSVLEYNARTPAPYPEKVVIEALKQLDVKVDWLKYTMYEKIYGKEE